MYRRAFSPRVNLLHIWACVSTQWRCERASLSRDHLRSSAPVQTGPVCCSERIPEAPETYGVCVISLSPRSSAHGAATVVAERSSPVESMDQYVHQMFSRGVPLGLVRVCTVVTMNASTTGWGAVCQGVPASGLWSESQSRWHINHLELKAVFLALKPQQNVCGFVHRSPGQRMLQCPFQAGCGSSIMSGLSFTLHQSRAYPGLLYCSANMLSRNRIPHRE